MSGFPEIMPKTWLCPEQFGLGCRVAATAQVRARVRVGHHCSIGSRVELCPDVLIGDRVRIHSNCFIAEKTRIHDHAWLGPNVVILNHKYPTTDDPWRPVTIEAGAVIGGGAVILPGVVIGANALVGAGAVVTRSVPPGAVVAGNPARVLKQRTDIAAYRTPDGGPSVP